LEADSVTVSTLPTTLKIDHAGAESLNRQLYRQLRSLIERQALASGSALPSTRVLAKDLGIGRNTVIAAYDQLGLEGYVRIRAGAAPIIRELPSVEARDVIVQPRIDAGLSARGRIMSTQPFHHGSPGRTAFHPGLPDADNFPFNTWSKLLTRRGKLARHDLFGTYHINGYPALRDAIARYLIASRGINCRAEQIIVTNGAQAAFDLLARLLLDPGDTVWMEEPGYYGAGAAFVCAGGRLEPLAVNMDGWQLDPPARIPRLIFVTPSCHHPLGLTMQMEQRLRLIALARTWGTWIIEDDFDGEYRFTGQPIPALLGIGDASRTVYVGTFAKILFPAMRLGFMVVPEDMCDSIAATLSATGQFAPLLTQAALADFINEGHLTRHLRRMRRIYAGRRQFFLDQCERHLPDWIDVHPAESGIQLVGRLRHGMQDMVVAGRARAHDVNVSPLSIQYRHGQAIQGLVMGFAASDERATLAAVQRLQAVFRAQLS
jgi:GntR family transcriptional regulator / MocR family aminotransferase